ncbi:MAG: hypothetical protein JO261_01870 [Alphaproteobacteria bacterium]|nr:hypothetical protein [Alphaproteobacteria bacterium]MBV9692426.1 hypothetical protein [Alphaproteobacteria bacterium]
MRSGLSVFAAAAAALLSTSALASPGHQTPLPSHHGWTVDPAHPPYTAPANSASGTWSALTNAFPGSGFPDTSLLLTDGTVMMHDGCTTDWYRLTPDNTGSYVNGSWTKMASMPSGYSPLYFASQVLPDGHVIINGGEYINCSAVWTNKGALYDTATNTWTTVTPPSGWTHIGDAQSVVRADGNYMVANCCSQQEAIATISGTSVTWTSTGTGKGDENDEEGWTQIPGGMIFTVDANRDLGSQNDVEIYSESSGAWTTQSTKTPVSCTDPGSHEIGPAPLLPNGLIYQLCGTAHTAVYDPVAATWTTGPDVPNVGGSLDIADGPAAVLPDGNVLFQASPGVFQGGPSHFFEATVTDANNVTITQVSEPASASGQNSYEGRLMVLPSGQVLWASDVGDVEIYTPQGKPAKNAIPKIKKVKASLTVGSSNNKISGFGFNGLTFGGYYGDDVQQSTNYPIVRITNVGSGHVCFGKTHNYATGISDGSLTNAKFDIPATCETGASNLQVVVNGIASKVKAVTLN